MNEYKMTWYQEYYWILALLKERKYSKLNRNGLHYHHVKPVSLFGQKDNLIICVPFKFHTRLHYLLWKHYEENGNEDAAKKMKYAYEQLNSKYGCVFSSLNTIKPNFKLYKHLMSAYDINIPKTE